MSVAQNYQIPDTLLTYRNLDLKATGQVVKSSGGKIYEYHISNNNAAALYVKMYDKATAPTNSDTPIRTLFIPTKAVIVLYSDHGIPFANGISLRACTGVADNDNTAPSTNDVVANISYL